MEIIMIITIILNILFVLISFYLLFLFIKSTGLHNCPCYNMMIISLIILIDNAFRLLHSSNYPEIFQYIQAFTLTFLDKLLLTTMTSQAFILYLGIVKTQFYFKYEKVIFFLTLILEILICSVLTTLYIIIGGKTDYEEKNKYFYCGISVFKYYADPIFDSIFLLLNIIFFVKLLTYFSKKKKEVSQGETEDLDYGKNFTKFLLMSIVNTITFVESYLIIFEKIPIQYIDIIYLSTCLIIDLVYNINDITIKETVKIFCKKTYEEKYRETGKDDSLLSDD